MMSNIWITNEYQTKVDEIIQEKDVFKISLFFDTHQYRDYNDQTEDNTQDHDINIVDDITFDIFIDHLNCYF